MAGTYRLKVVPDAQPDAEGVWEEHRLEREPTWGFKPRQGHHIVKWVAVQPPTMHHELAFERRPVTRPFRENQTTIDAWARETFGFHPPLVIASRMNVEVAELMQQLGEASAQDEELSGLLQQLVDLSEQISIRVHELDDRELVNPSPHVDASECADVAIVLVQVAEGLGTQLSEAVDEKMEINRRRTWGKTAAGRFQHV
jgi:hypothetical protein